MKTAVVDCMILDLSFSFILSSKTAGKNSTAVASPVMKTKTTVKLSKVSGKNERM